MDRVRALAGLNGKIMAAYSDRTIEALRAALPLRLAIPHLEPALALNLAKEVRKDALVIRRAGDAITDGVPVAPETVQEIFDATADIDRLFLERLRLFPVRIVIRYEDIAPVRMQRIERLLGAAHRILGSWGAHEGLRAALNASYARPDLEQLLREMFRLYALETRALSQSVRLPVLLTPLRERVAHSLLTIMDNVASTLSADLARAAYQTRSPTMPISTSPR